MIWRRRSSLVVSYNSTPRRGLTPMTLLVLIFAAGIGFVWYQVFSPLFDDPRDWAERERAFRGSIHEILKGSSASPTNATNFSTSRGWRPCEPASSAARTSSALEAPGEPWKFEE